MHESSGDTDRGAGADPPAQARGAQGPPVDAGGAGRSAAVCSATSRAERDLLIEHLHSIQDGFGHLSAAHLAALAQEMRLAQTEVYEVATFYHHFDIVKEGEPAPPAMTVRVCDGLSCEMAGAQELLAQLPALLGSDVRVIAAPCIGRCEQAPAAVVGQNPVPPRDCDDVSRSGRSQCRSGMSTAEPSSTTTPIAPQAATQLLNAMR